MKNNAVFPPLKCYTDFKAKGYNIQLRITSPEYIIFSEYTLYNMLWGVI